MAGRRRQLRESDLKIEAAMVAVAYVLAAANLLCFIAIVAGYPELMSWLVFFMDTGQFIVRFLVLALAGIWLYFGITWHRDLAAHRKLYAEQHPGSSDTSDTSR